MIFLSSPVALHTFLLMILLSHFIDTDLCLGAPAVSPICDQLSALYTPPLLPPLQMLLDSLNHHYTFVSNISACLLNSFSI